jgi:hypothetical protein
MKVEVETRKSILLSTYPRFLDHDKWTFYYPAPPSATLYFLYVLAISSGCKMLGVIIVIQVSSKIGT